MLTTTPPSRKSVLVKDAVECLHRKDTMLVWAIYLKPKALVVGTEWRNPLFYKDAIIVLTEISIFTCDSCGNTLEYADWSKFPEGWAMYCTPNGEEAKHLCPDCMDVSRFGCGECSTKQAKFTVRDTVGFEGDLYLVRDVTKEEIKGVFAR